MPPTRSEQDVFNELAQLCARPGYAHAIAHLCFRDNIIPVAEELTPDIMREMFSPNRLIRTEISTLIGLMLKFDLDLTHPSSKVIQEYIDQTEKLLLELHQSMSMGWLDGLTPEKVAQGDSPFMHGKNYREPIFYGGESAYVFQYRDLAITKYSSDNDWLISNKGFAIEEARAVVQAIEKFQEEKLFTTLNSLKAVHPEEWTLLPGFIFSLNDLTANLGIGRDTIAKILTAFSLSQLGKNASFSRLDDFNAANAFPLIPLGDENFLLFQSYSLAEALFDSPFYWMGSDKSYVATAMKNRGLTTEAFARRRFERVFGKEHVHANVDIFETKGRKAGEIDVLVLFGNRAIVLQAKSKRLTLEARKGNDGQIKDDFKKAIQDSYNQGLSCAKHILGSNWKFRDPQSNEIAIPRDIKEVYVICLVSDHYPALSFQARHFLKTETVERIPPPFVMDMFTLDTMTEMLDSPLRLLSYLDRRVKYSDRLLASHELTILAYHLSKNLWLDDEATMTMLGDDFSAPLDTAMAVRRAGIPGKRTPEGILTRLTDTAIGRIIKHIEARAEQGTVDLGFLLLLLSEDTVLDASRMMDMVSARARQDGKPHDVTIAVGNSGLTIHYNDIPRSIAESSLKTHCRNRKYLQKAETWFGLCLQPSDSSIRFGLKLDYGWQKDDKLDRQLKNMAPVTKNVDLGKSTPGDRKIGRNETCPCGSGRKYKKCHGAA